MVRLFVAAFLLSGIPLGAQDVKGNALKHLKISKTFTVKVAEAMPADSYDFKLTPPQMSFGEQLTHLAQGMNFFLSPFVNQKPSEAKPASQSKADMVAFIRTSFDKGISQVEALNAKQIAATYQTQAGSQSGLDLLLGLLDRTTHHRASAEMYLRAKGITPPQYNF